MEKSIFNNPVGSLFKGSLDLNKSDQELNFSVKISCINLYYSFVDYEIDSMEDESVSLSYIYEKAITSLEYLRDRNIDIFIYNEEYKMINDIHEYISILERKDKNSKNLLFSSYIYLLATDNNISFMKELMSSVYDKYYDIDYTVVLAESRGRIVINNLKIPNYFMVEKDFLNIQLKNANEFISNIKDSINLKLNEHDMKIFISMDNYDDYFVDVKMSIHNLKNRDLSTYSDSKYKALEKILSECFLNYIHFSQYRLLLSNNNKNKLCFNGIYLRIATRNNNKELFNGNLLKSIE